MNRLEHVVIVLHRGPEESHDRIPDVLIHDSLAILDDIHHKAEILVQRLDDLLRRHGLRDPGKVPDVGKQHRQDPAFTDQHRFGMSEKLVDHIRGHVLLKDVADLLLPLLGDHRFEGVALDLVVGLLQLSGHEVEGVSQVPDFILVLQLHSLGQIAGSDNIFHGGHHVVQGLGEVAHEHVQHQQSYGQCYNQDEPGLEVDLVHRLVENIPMLGDQKGPPEGPETGELSHPGRAAQPDLGPTFLPGPGKVDQPRDLLLQRLDGRGAHGDLPLLVQCQDQLALAPDQASGEGDHGCFGHLHVLRPCVQLVFHQQIPLRRGVVPQLLGLELEKLRGYSGDPVPCGQGGGKTDQQEGGDDQGYDDQDELCSNTHGELYDTLDTNIGSMFTRLNARALRERPLRLFFSSRIRAILSKERNRGE